MTEYEYNQSEDPDYNEPGALAHLQDEANRNAAAPGSKKQTDATLAKGREGDAAEAPKNRPAPKYDKAVSEKLGEIITKYEDLIFEKMALSRQIVPKVGNLVLTQMAEEKIVKDNIPNYDKLSTKEKKEKTEEFFKSLEPDGKAKLLMQAKVDILKNNQIQLSERTKAKIFENIREEIGKREFGEFSRAAYSVYVDAINSQVNAAAKILVNQQLEFPKCDCPIKIPEDKNGKYNAERFRAAITSGEAQSRLPTYGNDSNLVPNLANRNELVQAEHFCDAALAAIAEANLDSQVKAIKDRLELVFLQNPPPGLMPNPALLEKGADPKQAHDYIDRAKPVVALIEQLNNAARAIKALKETPGTLSNSTNARLDALLRDFPGEPPHWEGSKFIITPDYPENLQHIEKNRGINRAGQNWLTQVYDPLKQIKKECDFASRNPDSVCHWAHIDTIGVNAATGKLYNRVEFRYDAEPVKVQVMRVEDGTTALEDRIKVTTSKQCQWAGIMPEVFGATNIGAPVVSGRATVNGAALDPSGTSVRLQEKAEVRLSKDGIIQAKVIDRGAEVRLVDAKGKSYELKPDNNGNDRWFDVLPGLSLQIGGQKIDLKNDVRYYKLDQTVAVKGSGGYAELAQASELPAHMKLDAAREFLSEAVPLIVDIGFTLTGALEAKALIMAPALAKKVIAEVVAKVAERNLAREVVATAAERNLAHEGAALTGEAAVGEASLAINEAGALSGLARTVTITEEAAAAVSTLEDLALLKTQALTKAGLSPEAQWATAKSAAKHGILGVAGLGRHPVEAALNEVGKAVGDDRLGSQAYAARGVFMAADMIASSGWTGALGRGWTKLFAGNEKLITTGLSSIPLLGAARVMNQKALKIADFYYGPQMGGELLEEGGLFVGLIPDAKKRAEQEGKALVDLSDRMTAFKGQAPEVKFAESLVSLLHKEDQQAVKTAVNKISSGLDEGLDRESKISELAAKFIYPRTDQQTKLIAALGLLKLRYAADGSLPEVLAAQNLNSGPETIVTLADVRDFLVNYNAVRFTDLPKQPVLESFNNSVRNFLKGDGLDKKLQTLVDETSNVLMRAIEDPIRKEHINKLANIFQGSGHTEREKIIAGMGLVFLNTDPSTGSVKQILGERTGVRLTMQVAGHKDDTSDTVYWNMDEEAAKKAAMQPFNGSPYSISITKTTPVKEEINSQDALFYLRQQLARTDKIPSTEADSDKKHSQYTYSAQARLDLADTLMRCGQMNLSDHGGICFEILTDPKTEPGTKAAALMEDQHHRVAQLLTEYNGLGLTDEARSIVEEITNNPSEDRNVRALAVAILHISTIGSGSQKGIAVLDQMQRTTKFKALQESWRSTSHYTSEQGTDSSTPSKPQFADSYMQSLLDKLTNKDTASFEQSQAARIITQLADASIISLSPGQEQIVFNTLLKNLDIVTPPGGIKFVDTTKLNIRPQSRESIRQAISILANHSGELNESDPDQLKSMQQLRTRMTQILALPNQGNRSDAAADPEGESRLKILALENIGKIYARANQTEVKALAESLRTDILALRVPSEKEGRQQKFNDLHSQLLKAEIKCLTQLTLAQANKDQSGELRTSVVNVLKDLAMPSNKAFASWTGHTEITINVLAALNNLRPVEGLYKLCSNILERENNIAVREEAEGLRKLLGVQDPDSYNTEYLKSKRDIRNASNIKLTELPDTISCLIRPLCLTTPAADRLSSGFSESEKLQMLRSALTWLPEAVLDHPPNKSQQDYDLSVVNGTAYLMSSPDNSIVPPFNAEAEKLATKAWARIEDSDRADLKQITGPLSALLLVNASSLSYPARQEVLRGMLKNNTLSDKEKATIISMALEQVYHRTPHNIANPHFKESQDYQLALLAALEPLQTSEQIPVLAAIVDEKPRSSLERDPQGLNCKVNYPDGSSRSVSIKDGTVLSFCFTDKAGKNDKWLLDKESGNFFKESDLKDKKHPWNCKAEFLADGSLVITDAPNIAAGKGLEEYQHGQLSEAFFAGKAGQKSPGGTLTFTYGSQTIYTRDGAKIVEIPLSGKNDDQYSDNSSAHRSTDRWVQATYADGSVRSLECNSAGLGLYGAHFTPAGGSDGLSRDELTAADSLSFPLAWYRNPPAWFSGLNINVSQNATGYNSDTHSFWREDLSAIDGVTYRMTLETDGRKTMERHERKSGSQSSQITTLFMSTGADNTASHPMPLVRQKALSMLADLGAQATSATTDTKTNPSAPGSADMDQLAQSLHERYGAVKLAIESSNNNHLVDFKPESIIENDRYKMLDARYRDDYAKREADKNLAYWWLVGYSADYAGSANEAMMQAEKKIDRLKVTASGGLANVSDTDISPNDARLMLASLASQHGTLGGRAIKAIAEMAAGSGPGSVEMMDIVAHDVIGEPTIGSANRAVLFEAVKSHALRHSGSAAKAKMAKACCKILEIEYQTMPSNHDGPFFRQSTQYTQSELFQQSEQVQLDSLKFLKDDLHYDGNMASVRGLYELSPSKKVQLAAAELLRLPAETTNKLAQEIAKSQAQLGEGVSSKKNVTPLPHVTIEGT